MLEEEEEGWVSSEAYRSPLGMLLEEECSRT